jgi:rhodanese-related sulfurtransferase
MKLVSIVMLFSCAAYLPAQTQPRSSEKVAHNEGFLKLVNDAKSRIRQIDIEGYKKMLASGQKPVLVDVREDSEWDAGHAAGSVHIGKGVIERDIEAKVPEKNTKMVLYCGGGFRSALAADVLQNMGYKDVISLDGGWRAYQQAGLPVEKSK